jgi:hypothetical protein
MNIKSFKKIVIILSLLIGGSNIILASDFNRSTFLFCLKPDIQPLSISKSNNKLLVNNSSIQNFIDNNNIENIEPWLPGARETDHDGDIYLNRIYRVSFQNRTDEEITQIKNQLDEISEIHSSEFEFKRKPFYIPNDQYYNNQWFLPAINSNDAWNFWTNVGDVPGNRDVILASVDTGVNWTHADLRNNLWENLGEDANGNGQTVIYSGSNWYLDPGDLNGIDDDDWDNNSNTFIDDLVGWDISGLNGVDDNDPDPPHTNAWSHGTHVAGLLSATTDNDIGIASTAFNCSIMAVKGCRSYSYIIISCRR